MAFCVHMYIISHVTYEDFPPYIEKWYTPKIPRNNIITFIHCPNSRPCCLNKTFMGFQPSVFEKY